jgi:hypothetical protein
MPPGDIYLIRDFDLRTNGTTDYLKIGLTKPNDTDQRIAAHQTGNPRLITKEWSGVVPDKTAIETHLHHYFSGDRIRGEWFWIDDAKMNAEVIPMINNLIAEYTAHQANLAIQATFKSTDDNGVSRPATAAENLLVSQLQTAMNELEKAKKQHEVHELTLKTLLGTSGGIDGVGTLTEVAGRSNFEQDAFLASLSTTDKAKCVHPTKTVRVAKVDWKIKAAKLATLDATLATSHSSVKSAAPKTLPLTQVGTPPAPRTPTIETEHQSWLNTRRAIKVNEWKVIQLKTQILVSLGADKEITDVVSWERSDEVENDVFDKSLATEHFETQVAAFTKRGPPFARFNISSGRGYP